MTWASASGSAAMSAFSTQGRTTSGGCAVAPVGTRQLGGEPGVDRLVDRRSRLDPRRGRLQRRDAFGDLALVEQDGAEPGRHADRVASPVVRFVPVDGLAQGGLGGVEVAAGVGRVGQPLRIAARSAWSAVTVSACR